MDLHNKTHPNFSDICEVIQTRWPPHQWGQKNVLVAVSGGADSVLLLRAMHQLHTQQSGLGELIVCHINHGTRDAAPNDANFTRQLAQECKLKFSLEICATSDLSLRSEEDLRQERYQLLMKIAEAHGARYLATGHNQQDQIETALFRMFRGTSFKGLSGIPPLRVQGPVSIIRPLLPIPRSKIVAALQEIDQSFCIDASNQSSHYTRNFLRNKILPDLRKRFPGLDQSILRLTQQANEFQDYLHQETQPLFESVRHISGRETRITKRILENAHPVLIKQLLTQVWADQNWSRQDMNRSWWERLCELVQDREGQETLNLPGNIRVASNPAELHFLSPPL